MSIRNEQCNKVCRIIDDVLANRPTERDSLIVAVQKSFKALEGNSSESPNGWVPCTKEYPKPWELVWTTDKHGNVDVCQLSHKDGDWYDADEEWFYNHDNIIAWMPYEVPKPYQEVEE